MHDTLSATAGILLLALIIFARSYKHRLELFRGDWLFASIKLWYIAGLALALGSQYLLYNSHLNSEFILDIDAAALYLAYIQICRD